MKEPIAQKEKKKQVTAIETHDTVRLIKWIMVIMVIGFIAFAPALNNEFVNWDDYSYIRDNPLIRSITWSNIEHIFNFNTFIVCNYHPLTILSYAIEYQAAGTKPFLYHFDNILLHLLNIALFGSIIWLLTKKFYATIIATALFAVHPMRVESVAWASERKDVLYTFFFFLAILIYIHYSVKSNYKIKYYILSLGCFILSLLSKGQAVVLPLTFLLIDYWHQKKFNMRLLLDKIPFLMLSLVFGIIAIHAQASELTAERLISHTLAERFLFAGYNLSAYLYKLVLPYFLSSFYNFPTPNQMGMIYFGAVITLILFALVLFRFRNNRTIMFGTLLYLFTIFIVIQILPIGNAIIADRYTYIPYIGLFFIVGMLLDKLISSSIKWRKYVIYIVIIQLFIFTGSSFVQSMTWKNNETLWNQIIKINPKEGMAYSNLGVSYIDKQDYSTAIELLQKAIQFKENYPEAYKAYYNLGVCYKLIGDKLKALQYYDAAINMQSNFSDAFFNRGLVNIELERYDAAIADFTSIIDRVNPKKADWYFWRASAYKKCNLIDSAIADYNRTISIQPDYARAYTNLGNIYLNADDPDKALLYYNTSLKYAPDRGLTYLNRSFAYFHKLDYQHALSDAETAISLKQLVSPEYVEDLKARIAEQGK